jgi:hypothetical protein
VIAGATRDTHPAVMAGSGSLLPDLAVAPVSLLPRQPATSKAADQAASTGPCAALLDLFAVAHAERTGSRRGDTGAARPTDLEDAPDHRFFATRSLADGEAGLVQIS